MMRIQAQIGIDVSSYSFRLKGQGAPPRILTRIYASYTTRALSGTVTAEGGLLPFWGAAVLLAGYGLFLAAAGTRLVVRREIT